MYYDREGIYGIQLKQGNVWLQQPLEEMKNRSTETNDDSGERKLSDERKERLYYTFKGKPAEARLRLDLTSTILGRKLRYSIVPMLACKFVDLVEYGLQKCKIKRQEARDEINRVLVVHN